MKNLLKVGNNVKILRYNPPIKGFILSICKYSAEELQREETIRVLTKNGKLEYYSPKELEKIIKV